MSKADTIKALRVAKAEKTPDKKEERVVAKGKKIPTAPVPLKVAKPPKGNLLYTKNGEIDKRSLNHSGRPKIIQGDNFRNTSVNIDPESVKKAKENFGGLRQAIEWANKNFKK